MTPNFTGIENSFTMTKFEARAYRKLKGLPEHKAKLNRLGKLTKFLVKRSKSHSTLDKACQHRLESNEFNSTWHSPSKLWRNRYIKQGSRGAFWQSKLEPCSSKTDGDLRLQVTWNKIVKTGSRQSKKWRFLRPRLGARRGNDKNSKSRLTATQRL